MTYRLVALDEGPNIPIDREMVIIGRHPQCDARLDSIRVSRRHCCMFEDNGEVYVRDLGSTNGIRINGQRLEKGRLRPGDELSIAHIRFRLDDGQGQDMTLAEPSPSMIARAHAAGKVIGVNHGHPAADYARGAHVPATPPASPEDNPLAAAVRELLPPGMGDRCRIQVIVQMQSDESEAESSSECRNGHQPQLSGFGRPGGATGPEKSDG